VFKIVRSTEATPSDLEELITNHIKSMDGIGPETEEATTAANNLKTLMEARAIEDQIEKPWRPSADTVATVAGSLLGIAAILSFEKAHVITTKSLSLIMRPKS
jgi:hypothetical protein